MLHAEQTYNLLHFTDLVIYFGNEIHVKYDTQINELSCLQCCVLNILLENHCAVSQFRKLFCINIGSVLALAVTSVCKHSGNTVYS